MVQRLGGSVLLCDHAGLNHLRPSVDALLYCISATLVAPTPPKRNEEIMQVCVENNNWNQWAVNDSSYYVFSDRRLSLCPEMAVFKEIISADIYAASIIVKDPGCFKCKQTLYDFQVSCWLQRLIQNILSYIQVVKICERKVGVLLYIFYYYIFISLFENIRPCTRFCVQDKGDGCFCIYSFFWRLSDQLISDFCHVNIL